MNKQSIDKELAIALTLLQKGDIHNAVEELKVIITDAPNCDQAHYFLSLGLYGKGDLKGAAASIERAIQINPETIYIKDAIDIYFDLGLQYKEKNEYKEAIEYFEKTLKANPNDTEAMSNIAVCHFKEGNFESSKEYFIKLLQIDSRNISAYINLGKIYEKEENFEEAFRQYQKAGEIEPNNSEILLHIGLIYSKREEYKCAVESFKKAVQLNPDDDQTLYNLGPALLREDQYLEAITVIEKAIKVNSDFPEYFLNYGLALFNLERYTESIEYYKKALAIKHDYIQAYINLGIVYLKLNEFENSLKNYKKALAIDPNNTCALVNYGYLLQVQNDNEKAIQQYNKIISLEPDNADAHFLISTVYLSLGNYENGWEEYEWRFKRSTKDSPKLPKFDRPRWKGESLWGKTIYVSPEQGFGDAIQFVRYFKELAKISKKVIYRVRPELETIFRRNFKGVEILTYSVDPESIGFDCYTPLLSVPRILKTNLSNIPFSEGYIEADIDLVQKYKEEYFSNDLFKVGIFWQSDTKVNGNRHIPVEKLLPILNIDGVKVYSLQNGVGLEQLEALSSDIKITDLGSKFCTFSDTAAALKHLDLIVTIDTSVAHLAGALSKNTLLMLPYCPEWRWLKNIDYTPWYKSIKILRQTEINNWDEVIDKVCSNISSRNV